MSQMMDPAMMGGPPPPDAGGGLPPELMAALGGGPGGPAASPGPGNSADMMAQGPMAGQDPALAEEPDGTSTLEMVREAIEILRTAGAQEPDDILSHSIDKVQAELQKILAGDAQKANTFRSALGG